MVDVDNHSNLPPHHHSRPETGFRCPWALMAEFSQTLGNHDCCGGNFNRTLSLLCIPLVRSTMAGSPGHHPFPLSPIFSPDPGIFLSFVLLFSLWPGLWASFVNRSEHPLFCFLPHDLWKLGCNPGKPGRRDCVVYSLPQIS